MVCKTLDANEAVAEIAYQLNEVIAIYPITPSSPMSEWADVWQSEGRPNIWGHVPVVMEMQSEGGAAGVIHGALQTGSLSTTFTSSQGLLLMIPAFYKIAGELTPAVFHVAARSVATQALSIFGDHSDVMAARQTGFGMLASASVQEAHDFALISQRISLESRVPFIHFFDGFRTSHEIAKIQMLSQEVIRDMIDDSLITAHKNRALTPERPVLRGTSQNPDVFFQSRETVNLFYSAVSAIAENAFARFERLTGRGYRLYEYSGHAQPERVIVLMGSGCETVDEVVEAKNKQGEKLGVLKVRLYRPFDAKKFAETLPSSVKAIAVLDRTKEPGAVGEPLYLDVLQSLYAAVSNGWGQWKKIPILTGGRYGLSSKEFTPAMVCAVFEHLKQPKPMHGFTVGIHDDISHLSLAVDSSFSLRYPNRFEALFYGLGSDGTVGANKNTIKIIGEKSSHFAQGYFVYDSKKSGAATVSHLRFGPEPIRSPYLIQSADFIGCHQTGFLKQKDILNDLKQGGTFLLNVPGGASGAWDALPDIAKNHLIQKKARFFAIDAYRVASECGIKGRINTVMQACFFAITDVFEKKKAISEIKQAIEHSYGRKGGEVVEINLRAVDQALEALREVTVLKTKSDSREGLESPIHGQAPRFVTHVLGEIISGHGDQVCVSALPADGTYPLGTSKYEKRNLAAEIPVWEPELCIQCAKCVIACPHAVIRAKACSPDFLENAPASFKSASARNPEWDGLRFSLQVAPEDCTGCAICVDVCPAKSKSQSNFKAINMRAQAPLRDQEKENWNFFESLPVMDRRKLDPLKVREQQMMEPLFEFSSACAGCGETPYLKLLSQLFGDRSVIANATGCSSIYGGNLPTTPWAKDANGRGPAWSNSLFENNAEFGLGMRISIDKQKGIAEFLLKKYSVEIGEELVRQILEERGRDEASIYEQRQRIIEVRARLERLNDPEMKTLGRLADYLVRKSVWIVGGDGWAYDIGFGGLDHVLASGEDVNILVLDTEVYSNTGGQKSKSTPRSAVAKFATGGKDAPKKDLGLIAMTYGNAYVASVAMGAKDEHTLKAFIEAESYAGPSLIIAYSHCIAHGIDMSHGMQNQKAAFESGRWPLYRFDPRKLRESKNPLFLEMPSKRMPMSQYVLTENRFKMLLNSRPEQAKNLFKKIEEDAKWRQSLYGYLASRLYNDQAPASAEPVSAKGAEN